MLKDSKKLLSIIIPHYNTPELLEKLILTIPDYDDIQIIVVDDKSNVQLDKLNGIKAKYNHRIEFYINDTLKKGAGTCRNIGLHHANGKWILFADSDDFFTDNMYESVSPYFETDYDEVFFIPTSIYIDTGETSNRHIVLEKRINDYNHNPTRDNLLKLKVATATPVSILINNNIIKKYKIKFDEVLYSNDIMFMTKVGHYSQKITTSKNVIYCITRNKGSLTTHISHDVYKIRLQEYVKVCRFLLKNYSVKDVKIMHYTCVVALYGAIKRHYGIKECLSVLKVLRKYNVPFFSFDLLKLDYIKQLLNDFKQQYADSKYLIKTQNINKKV
ncbi:MAG: glycosyltransferase family 2 protein [Lachnospiraceae bacterium]|nr:glycosyltransferase family 2 protein [Lachnospiraceae bacterium]